ncbi:MAG: cyclic pyranopterin monophosphate synthase MoaC [Pseudomonadales bacterium]|jgi:cyclic pyranopterin phosphate synthase|nr:cyclic pyranopterin monophosphate synthase MoaC [Pseudomonadales bacterium]
MPPTDPASPDADSAATLALSHLDAEGRARMVDVGDKAVTSREARARATLHMRPETLARIVDNAMPKGDVLAVARIAGIQGAKRTADLIPLCHQIPLSSVTLEFRPEEAEGRLQVEACCRTEARTGVEMEALTAVSIAALTVYDMCKAVEKGMRIGPVELLEKRGGRSGHWVRDGDRDPSP